MASRLGTVLAICRVSNLPTVWMNVLAASFLALPSPPPAVVALLLVAMSAFYGGGMALNDYCDREIDAREQPFRPIPSGRIEARATLWLALALLGTGLALLALAPRPSVILPGVVLVLVIYAYDRWHKAHAATVLLMASARTLVYVVSAWALTGGVSAPVLIAGLASFFWTLAVTIVARRESARGERPASPLVPWMIAGMATLDGVILAAWVSPSWLLGGLGATALTRLAQRFVRGD